MNILVLCDDLWHPGEVIVRGLTPLKQYGYDLDVVMAPRDILTPDMLRRYEVIINARSNMHSPANASAPWFSPGTAVMPKDFRDYIEEGHGFLALHAGNSYRLTDPSGMVELNGNHFVSHPPQCTVTAKPVGTHPITDGIGEFSFRDEHYMIEVHAEDIHVFLHTVSDTEAGTQIAGYTRTFGKGRFCCLTPGHNLSVFEQESFAKLLRNALAWCAGN